MANTRGTPVQPAFLTQEEVSLMLRVPACSVCRWLKEDSLPVCKVEGAGRTGAAAALRT